MSEQIKAKIKRQFDKVGEDYIDSLDELFAPAVIFHVPPYPDVKGLEEGKQFVRGVRSAFPDLQLVIEEIIVEGSTSVVRFTLRGTNTGPYPLVPSPTGKQVTWAACEVMHWEGGKVVEDWVHADTPVSYTHLTLPTSDLV